MENQSGYKKIGEWAKGRKRSVGTRKKMSISRLGISYSDITKKRMSESKLKNPTRYWLGKKRDTWWMRGEMNYRWNPNREEVKRNERNDAEYLQFVKKVKQRDKGVCRLQSENCKGYKIVHHILSWSEYPDERYNINNGITLCQYHHPRKRVDEQRLILTLEELVGSNKNK